MSVAGLTGADRATSTVIDVTPEVYRRGSTTVVGFTTSTRDRSSITVQFEMEGMPEPSELAATEAMTIAAIALAMQQRCALRVHGRVARSLRHTIDLYQEACAWWWPQRYRKVPIEVGILDDRPPATTRGILCFSGGLDSVFSAQRLGAAGQIEAGLLVEGYDIDSSNVEALRRQRLRVERLLGRLDLLPVVIRTNVREVLGQDVIEGAQGSYLAAALTLVSDNFGRGFVSSGILDLGNIGEGDPVHEAALPLLGSARYPIHVYGGQVTRFEKLRQLAAEPELFSDVRVCLERTDDKHCGRCSKCLLNAFACVTITGEWPVWLPQHKLDFAGFTEIAPTPHRSRYAREILRMANGNGESGEWLTALADWLEQQDAAPAPPPAQRPLRRRPWRRLVSKMRGVRRGTTD